MEGAIVFQRVISSSESMNVTPRCWMGLRRPLCSRQEWRLWESGQKPKRRRSAILGTRVKFTSGPSFQLAPAIPTNKRATERNFTMCQSVEQTPFRPPKRFSPFAAMTAIGSDMLLPKDAASPAFPLPKAEKSRCPITRRSPSSATKSRSCLQGGRL
jgi:hypothetical protein